MSGRRERPLPGIQLARGTEVPPKSELILSEASFKAYRLGARGQSMSLSVLRVTVIMIHSWDLGRGPWLRTRG